MWRCNFNCPVRSGDFGLVLFALRNAPSDRFCLGYFVYLHYLTPSFLLFIFWRCSTARNRLPYSADRVSDAFHWQSVKYKEPKCIILPMTIDVDKNVVDNRIHNALSIRKHSLQKIQSSIGAIRLRDHARPRTARLCLSLLRITFRFSFVNLLNFGGVTNSNRDHDTSAWRTSFTV